MPLGRVQASPRFAASNAPSVAITFTTPPVVGNGIAVAVITNASGSASQAATCRDNRGNAYTLARSQASPNNDARAAVFYCPAIFATGAPFTITVAVSGTTYFVARAIELNGVGTGLGVDQSVGLGGGSTLPATGSTPALTHDEVFLLALHAIDTGQTAITVEPVTPPWLQEHEELSFSVATGEIDSRLRTGTLGTTQSCGWTDSTTASWAAVLVAFHGDAPVAPVHLSQFVVEVVTLSPAADAHLSQLVAETVSLPLAPAHLSQLVVETLGTQLPAPVYISQTAIELLTQPPEAELRASQLGPEIVRQIAQADLITQVSQVAVEIIYPYGCYVPPRLPRLSACPTKLPPDD